MGWRWVRENECSPDDRPGAPLGSERTHGWRFSGSVVRIFRKEKGSGRSAEEAIGDESESFGLNAQPWVRATLGNLDEAFGVLMQQVRNHSWPATIRSDPLYAEMRKTLVILNSAETSRSPHEGWECEFCFSVWRMCRW